MCKFKEKTTALVAGQPCFGHRTPGPWIRVKDRGAASVGRREGKRENEREREIRRTPHPVIVVY